MSGPRSDTGDMEIEGDVSTKQGGRIRKILLCFSKNNEAATHEVAEHRVKDYIACVLS
jgi:hypothetical protein